MTTTDPGRPVHGFRCRRPSFDRRTVFLCGVILLSLLPFPAKAQDDVRRAVATRTADAIRIDAALDESAWEAAAPVTEFTQFSPLEGTQPTQRTEVRILYDDDALYVGATMYDTDAEHIVARLARRDEEIDCDRFSIRLDSYYDRRTAYEFTITAAGTIIDILQYDDGEAEDASWDAVWEVQTSILPDRWVAEMRIPFSMLRFQDIPEQRWGMQMIRNISRNQEVIHWQLIPRAVSGYVSRFGTLDGIRNVVPRQTVEVLPYGVVEHARKAPFDSRPRSIVTTAGAGVDIKYRPSANFTIDATFNPDFGQVEADPAVLNLSTFETYYPERRPFFVEGIQIFRFTSFGEPGLFYSRRIGRSISARPPAGGYIEEEPGFASIIGAAKISGKTQSGFSYGVLEAVTAEENAAVVDSNGVRSEQTVEPLNNYTVLRLKQDIGDNSTAGMILTSLTREDRRPALVGAVDWNLRFLDNMYKVDGFLAKSRTEARGFLEEGAAGRAGFSKEGGEHWRGSVGADFTSRRFNVNDVGFFRRPNDYGFMGNILYRDDTVDEWKRIYNVSLNYHRRNNFDGANINHSWRLSGYLMLANYWELDVDVERSTGLHDDRETRGLGWYRKPAATEIGLSIETDPRASVVFDIGYAYEWDARGGIGRGFGVEAEIKPSPAATIELSVEHEQVDRVFAWVDNVDDPSTSPSLFSVFADRTTREWDLTSRSSYVITRDLTVQWYLQLFIAKGYYENEMRRLGEDDYLPYVYDSEDFTESSVRSTLVLRWEYLPGSTLYAVWSHSRGGEMARYISSLRANLEDTFSLYPDNIFLLKISYWLSS